MFSVCNGRYFYLDSHASPWSVHHLPTVPLPPPVKTLTTVKESNPILAYPIQSGSGTPAASLPRGRLTGLSCRCLAYAFWWANLFAPSTDQYGDQAEARTDRLTYKRSGIHSECFADRADGLTDGHTRIYTVLFFLLYLPICLSFSKSLCPSFKEVDRGRVKTLYFRGEDWRAKEHTDGLCSTHTDKKIFTRKL